MGDELSTIWHEIVARPDGPLAVRFDLQPLMALLFATRDDLHDARVGRSPYLWGLATDPAHRGERLREGWRSIGRIFVFALVLDTIYQITVFHGLQPVEGMVIAVMLAIVPYGLSRGLVTRIARRTHYGAAPSQPSR